MSQTFILPAAALLAALAGCATVPEASPERDAEAKEFGAPSRNASVYVFRNDSRGNAWQDDSVLYVNDRLIGATLPGTFFRIDLPAGEHELHGMGYDQGTLRLRAREGETHFVSLNVVAGTSHFARVRPAAGQREISRCCVLMDPWEPGQRPLLR